MNNTAITLLHSNATADDAFGAPYKNSPANKMGVVELPKDNPTALVSVSNDAENGSIKYEWTGGTTYATPAGIVKYNTIIVKNNITFTDGAPEVQYIEFEGDRILVDNPAETDVDKGHLTQLKGIYVHDGSSIIIEKTKGLNCATGAFLGTGATVYKGGRFIYPADSETNNYYGTWTLDQIVEW